MAKKLKIVLAQINSVVGDIAGNSARIKAAMDCARSCGADLVLTSELALSGSPGGDLFSCRDFLQACQSACQQLAQASEGLTLVVGHPVCENGEILSCASVFRQGQYIGRHDKRLSARPDGRIAGGRKTLLFDVCGCNIALAIGDEAAAALAQAGEQGADLLLHLDANVFVHGSHAPRKQALAAACQQYGLALLSCNLVGGADALVFEGRSFALDRTGACRWQGAAFADGLFAVQFDGEGFASSVESPPLQAQAAQPQPVSPPCAGIYQALVLGVRDYVEKNAFPGVLLGLSGGIDSALVLLVAVDALGAERVRTVMMASPYTAQMSLDDARALATQLQVQYDEIAITPAMQVFADLLQPFFAGLAADTTEENLQSRIRGTLLMALANKTGAMVLTTGNKSEFATGYSTLYGDMAGGFAVLKDVYKTEVYAISQWLHETRGVIPANILQRPPSAELRADQTDQDSLPDYEILDAILRGLIEQGQTPAELIADQLSAADVWRVAALLRRNEHKRRQAPPGVSVSRRGFDHGWHYPITVHDWRRSTPAQHEET